MLSDCECYYFLVCFVRFCVSSYCRPIQLIWFGEYTSHILSSEFTSDIDHCTIPIQRISTQSCAECSNSLLACMQLRAWRWVTEFQLSFIVWTASDLHFVTKSHYPDVNRNSTYGFGIHLSCRWDEATSFPELQQQTTVGLHVGDGSLSASFAPVHALLPSVAVSWISAAWQLSQR